MTWPNPSFTRWLGGPDRAIVESGLTLDIHRMAKRLPMGRGSSIAGRWQWTWGGEVSATIGYRIVRTSGYSADLQLNYRNAGESVAQAIRLNARPCRFGGQRWYATCPHTRRSAAKLYLPSGGPRFLSRHAYRLGYRSQCEGPIGRMMLRRDRLAARSGIDYDCPAKPKGMRWRTFDRIMDRIDAYDDAWGVEMMARFGIRF